MVGRRVSVAVAGAALAGAVLLTGCGSSDGGGDKGTTTSTGPLSSVEGEVNSSVSSVEDNVNSSVSSVEDNVNSSASSVEKDASATSSSIAGAVEDKTSTTGG